MFMLHPVAIGGRHLQVTPVGCTNVLNLCQSSVTTPLSSYLRKVASYLPVNLPVTEHHITSKIAKAIKTPNLVRFNNEYDSYCGVVCCGKFYLYAFRYHRARYWLRRHCGIHIHVSKVQGGHVQGNKTSATDCKLSQRRARAMPDSIILPGV